MQGRRVCQYFRLSACENPAPTPEERQLSSVGIRRAAGRPEARRPGICEPPKLVSRCREILRVPPAAAWPCGFRPNAAKFLYPDFIATLTRTANANAQDLGWVLPSFVGECSNDGVSDEMSWTFANDFERDHVNIFDLQLALGLNQFIGGGATTGRMAPGIAVLLWPGSQPKAVQR
jgi:hypothetical protein